MQVGQLAQQQQRPALRVRVPRARLELQPHVRHLRGPRPPPPAPHPPGLGAAPARPCPARPRLPRRSGPLARRAGPVRGARGREGRRAGRRTEQAPTSRPQVRGPPSKPEAGPVSPRTSALTSSKAWADSGPTASAPSSAHRPVGMSPEQAQLPREAGPGASEDPVVTLGDPHRPGSGWDGHSGFWTRASSELLKALPVRWRLSLKGFFHNAQALAGCQALFWK